MILTLLPLFSLLFSCFIMMMGFGLIGLLLPVRMGLESMNTDTIGLVLSMYAVGMLLGGLYARVLIIRAGHIRLFAAVAALASISILVCSLYTNPWLWGAMRILMGFCLACALAAIDSWLSETATQQTRGRILAANQIVIMGAIFIGQFLINLSSPSDETLFIIAGMLLSLALIPIVMSRKVGPSVEEVRPMSIHSMLRLSPLGVITCFFCGILFSGLINMLPLFAGAKGIEGVQLSLFMGAAVFGGFLLQFPVGYLSDTYDRRSVLFFLLLITVIASLLTPLFVDPGSLWPSMILIAVVNGVFACLYPISISETFDKVLQSDMVAAMGGLIAVYAAGSIIGPYSASLFMQFFGNNALFFFLVALEILLLLFVLYRMRVREALPIEDQEKFVIHGAVGASSLEVDPRFEHEEPVEELGAEAELVVAVAQENPATAIRMAISMAKNSPEQAGPLAAALTQVEEVDIARLFAAISKAAPEMSVHIAEALATASPDQAEALVEWLSSEQPDELSEIVVAIASAVPEQSMNVIGTAAEALVDEEPEVLLDIANSYATSLHENYEGMRPVDRAAVMAESPAVELYTRLAEVSPDQVADIATMLTDAMPEAATEVTEAYVNTLVDEHAALDEEFPSTVVDGEMTGTESVSEEPETDAEDAERITSALSDFINHITETTPDQAVAVATVLVESFPDQASDLIERLQSVKSLRGALAVDIDEKPAPDIFSDYPYDQTEKTDES